MISIASQANIGGGASAIALAEAFDRKDLILPAILVGSLGNALGTYLGFLVVYILWFIRKQLHQKFVGERSELHLQLCYSIYLHL